MNRPTCPKCFSYMVAIERRPDGRGNCHTCGHWDSATNFSPESVDVKKLMIENKTLKIKYKALLEMTIDILNRMPRVARVEDSLEFYKKELEDLK